MSKELIETGTIYPIPKTERYGSARDLFTIWFGGNLMILTVTTGSLTTTVFHLSVFPALWAIIAGNLCGGLLMALHAAQGPTLGVPQMVQARGQFGTWGAAFITLLVVLMYVGFTASNLVLGSSALDLLCPSLGHLTTVFLIALFCLFPALAGYKALHIAGKVGTALGALAILLSGFSFLSTPGSFSSYLSLTPSDTFVNFLGAFSIITLWQIAFAPYVSDYSRYLPNTNEGTRSAFIATYAGCCLGAIFPMLIGVGAGLGIAANGSVVTALATHLGWLTWPVFGAFTLGIAGPVGMNVYCGTLSLLSVLQTFLPRYHFGTSWRLSTTLTLYSLAAWAALFVADGFLQSYLEFMDMLMAIMVPWTAINLVDYYLIHHGSYDVNAFFKPDGGPYGRINKAAMFCFFLSLLAQLPFMSGHLYTGPFARLLHGADLSWIVGLVVTTPVYWFLARKPRVTAHSLSSAG
ncbi:cytosine permease [Acetobacter malorum]|uniref:purine-cytosine permease family protein n=1 Tax=Acetobacter malorum TaxID=178901 RepID=UPI00248EF407|nr:cytosine permease [Acetobacter malorum]